MLNVLLDNRDKYNYCRIIVFVVESVVYKVLVIQGTGTVH